MVDSVGAELLVSDSGGQGIPIVFLSGGPGMPSYLSDVADLVEGRRVVTYDQRGTGGSRVSDGDYSTEAHVADLESVRKSLGVERLHIFGHSWGGMLAQLYATTHIDSVASLFLCSPTPGVGSEWIAMEKSVMQSSAEADPAGSRSPRWGCALSWAASQVSADVVCKKCTPRFGSTTRNQAKRDLPQPRFLTESVSERLSQRALLRFAYPPITWTAYFQRPCSPS